MTTLLWILILLNAATLIVGWQLFRRTGGRSERSLAERVEAEAASRHLRDIEARERWRALDLEQLHPLNRDEVRTLLARLEGASNRVLSAEERAFLDRMVRAEGRMRGA